MSFSTLWNRFNDLYKIYGLGGGKIMVCYRLGCGIYFFRSLFL